MVLEAEQLQMRKTEIKTAAVKRFTRCKVFRPLSSVSAVKRFSCCQAFLLAKEMFPFTVCCMVITELMLLDLLGLSRPPQDLELVTFLL